MHKTEVDRSNLPYLNEGVRGSVEGPEGTKTIGPTNVCKQQFLLAYESTTRSMVLHASTRSVSVFPALGSLTTVPVPVPPSGSTRCVPTNLKVRKKVCSLVYCLLAS